MSEIRNFVFISPLTSKCATQKIEKLRNSSVWTCSHHTVILKIENKNTDFFMILA